jgi:hypothetical protein
MAGLKIEFSKKFDRVAQLLASKGSKKHLFPSSALEHSKVCTLSYFGLLHFLDYILITFDTFWIFVDYF